jgi:hypothetical protein
METGCAGVDGQGELFARGAVTTWLPDELLYSLASRFHRISGNPSAASTCQQLFGHAFRGSQHDLPSHLDEFVHRTRGAFGTAHELIHQHTILPFYFPFRSDIDKTDAIAAVRGNGIGSLKFRLGLLTSRFRANHPLKACMACMAEDRQRHGVAYWHRSHQFPGVWVCARHETLLHEATVKATGVGRFLWHLPDEHALTSAIPGAMHSAASSQLISRLMALSQLAQALSTAGNSIPFDFSRLRSALFEGLDRQGLLASPTRLRLAEASERFHSFVEPIRIIRELSALPATPEAARTQLTRLIGRPDTCRHPLRHLVLILWLFDSWPPFWTTYHADTSAHALEDNASIHPRRPAPTFQDDRKPRLLGLIAENQYSVVQACRAVGVDSYVGIAWAMEAGLDISLRPKTLTPMKKAKLALLLRRGTRKSAICQRLGIGVSTINRILRSDPALQDAWRQTLNSRTREAMRGRWRRLLRSKPAATPSLARAMSPAIYAWLYRNDRAWLGDSLKKLAPAVRTHPSPVNWAERDHQLANLVRKECLAIVEAHPGRPVALWQLYQRIPDLKAKLGALDRLPQTRRAIETAIRRRQKNARPSRLQSICRDETFQ